MPEGYVYEAIAWVIKDDKAVWKNGMSTSSLDSANQWAATFCEILQRENKESGYITITAHKELSRIPFDKAAKAAA